MTKTLKLATAAAGLALLVASPAQATYSMSTGGSNGKSTLDGDQNGNDGCCKYKVGTKYKVGNTSPLVGGKKSKIPGFGGPGTGTPGSSGTDDNTAPTSVEGFGGGDNR